MPEGAFFPDSASAGSDHGENTKWAGREEHERENGRKVC